MEMKRVLLSTLLSAALVLSFMPAAAFAENGTLTEGPSAGKVYAGAVAGAVTAGPADAAEGAVSVEELDNEELLMQYIDRKVGEGLKDSGAETELSAAAVNSRRSVLTKSEQSLYDIFAEQIAEVAKGDRQSTCFEVPVYAALEKDIYTKQELGVEQLIEGKEITKEAYDAFCEAVIDQLDARISRALRALIFDMPYELYWLDNTNAVGNYKWADEDISANENAIFFIDPTTEHTPVMTFDFRVSRDYSADATETKRGEAMTTEVNTELTKAAAAAAGNISGIIAGARGESDAYKLVLYRDEICRLTSYHPTAMEDPDFPYGDPWQLIYVFDGNPDTKVVCEGYSKAFQYLCDNTEFADRNVESRLVSGKMTQTGGKGISGDHMWNIVRLDDGHNYIADITNCDDDSDPDIKSFPSEVFLTGAKSGSASAGYTYSFEKGTIRYEYDEATRSLYSDSELTMSVHSYPHEKGDDSGVRAPNTMTAKGKKVTLKAKKLKKKKQTVAVKKAFTVKNAQGAVSYRLVKVNKKSAKKKFSVAKSGKITAKKGLKKGSYKLTIAVTASGDAQHLSRTQNVTVTVKVK